MHTLTLNYVNFNSSRENHKHNKRAPNSAGKFDRTVGKPRTVSLLKSELTEAVKSHQDHVLLNDFCV